MHVMLAAHASRVHAAYSLAAEVDMVPLELIT